MPELVPGGPDVPPQLMNDLDDERVVFFCGAGVSMGPESGLPDFQGLVEHVYEDCGIPRPARDARPRQLDRELDLLEQRLVRGEVRKSVIERLSAEPRGPLVLHEALIDLSRTTKGWRLVTTNFDNRFREAGLNAKAIDVAPSLPVPKPRNRSTLVHLHGRIPRGLDSPGLDGSNLVLTSADFGRAYLVERWAARFVTELFHHFTVVFVGYGLSDPVIRYLMDALDAERRKGGRVQRAYAFADSTSEAEEPWRSISVESIVYDDKSRHRLLRDTLVEWARIRSDPRARSRIVVNGITKLPNPIGDRDVARVTWAVTDPEAARALAEAPPVRDERDFGKIEAWLSEFDKAGLLGRDASHSAHSEGRVQLVDNGLLSQEPLQVDRVTALLATWIARHLHVPQVLAWVVQRGGRLHPDLRWKIRSSLTESDSSIPSRLRLLWTVLLQAAHTRPRRFVFQAKQHDVAETDFEMRQLEEEVLRSLAPRLVVHSGPPSSLRFQRLLDGDTNRILPIETCGHLRLRVGGRKARYEVQRFLADHDILARHSERLTGYLEEAIALLPDADDVPTDTKGDPKLWVRSWVAASGDFSLDGWTYLIDLARDSYMVLAKSDPRRAAVLLRRWASAQSSLFHRLALHAITENRSSEIGVVEMLLLRGSGPGLWRPDLRNEVLRFLNKVGSRLPQDLLSCIVSAIHAGPTHEPGSEDDQELIRNAKIRFLSELSLSGVELDTNSDSLLEGADQPSDGDFDQRYGVHSSRRAEVVDVLASVPEELTAKGVDELATVLEDDSAGTINIDGLVLRVPTKAARALRRLSKRDTWPREPWMRLLSHLSSLRGEKRPMVRLENYTARLLFDAPDGLLQEVGLSASRLIRGIAEDWDENREPIFSELWKRAWLTAGQSHGLGGDDPVTEALNQATGVLAEAALVRLWEHQPTVRGELPRPVRSYFEIIGKDPCGHLGRVMLTSRLNALFTIDPDWTGDHLLPLLDLSHSEEAMDLWAGFAWSPAIGPNLLKAFKKPFLSVLKHEDLGDRIARGLVSLLIAIGLDLPRALTKEETLAVMQALSEESLVVALRALGRRLTGEPQERETAWNDRVKPWLHDHWPKGQGQNTPSTSEEMIHLIIKCGSGLPDAVSSCLRFLQPTKGRCLLDLEQSEHAQDHPDAVLDLLDTVIHQDVFEAHMRSILGRILKGLAASKPTMTSDVGFRRLRRVAES